MVRVGWIENDRDYLAEDPKKTYAGVSNGMFEAQRSCRTAFQCTLAKGFLIEAVELQFPMESSHVDSTAYCRTVYSPSESLKHINEIFFLLFLNPMV